MNKDLETLYRNDYCVFAGSESPVIDVYHKVDEKLTVLDILLTKRIDMKHIRCTSTYEAYKLFNSPVYELLSKRQYNKVKEAMNNAEKEKRAKRHSSTRTSRND